MSIDTQHPEYKANKTRWDLVRSVIDNEAQKFIRAVDPTDAERNTQYRNGAILTNFTALTKEGLTGLVFRKAPKIELPAELEYLKEDATGDGRGLEQLAKQILGEVLITGRAGILTDYPRNEGGVSILDTENLKARMLMYRAENIINWKIEKIASESVIKYVVLYEPTLENPENDPFAWELKDKYRLLALDANMQYYQAMYDENLEIVDLVYPTDINGNKFDRIPFCFVGAEDNNEDVDKAPLYDIAVVNVGHYRNSADFEEAVFVVGQPTIFVSGSWGLEEFKEALPQGIKFGSRAGYFLGENGNAKLVQANPNQLAQEAMRAKEKQVAAIGARLIAEPGGRETAEAARLRYSSQNSNLHTIVLNVDLALVKSLGYCSKYMGGDPNLVGFELNRRFYDETADPNLIAQSIMLFDRGLVSREEIRDDLKQKNMLDVNKTIEELDEELENINPFGEVDESE